MLKHCNRLSRGVIDEQTDLVEDVSVHCRVGWTRWPLNIPFQPKFYHPMTFLYPTLHIWRWEWEGRIELPGHLWTELSFVFNSKQGSHILRRSSGCPFWGKASASSHIFPFSTDFLWTYLWNMTQNVSFKLDHSLEKFSIQSRYQKLSASLNKSRLPVVAFGALVGVGWGFLDCVVLLLQTAANFYQGPPDFSFDSPWVQRVGTTCHRSWHWEGCKRGHRLCSFCDRRLCSQTGGEQCAPTLSSAAKSSLFQLPDRKEELQKHGWAQADPR